MIATIVVVALSGAVHAQVSSQKSTADVAFEQKMSWILRLEDQRVLRDPAPPPAPAPPPPPTAGKRRKKDTRDVSPPPPPPPPDLVRLLSDGEARIRRRVALAVGRTRLADGVLSLIALMADRDSEVRQMAAFALGLIGDVRARDPLVAALADPSPLMQGSAAEALGLLGDASTAQPIALMASAIVASGALSQIPESTEAARDTPAAAFRLALSALVRLKAYDAVHLAALDQAGQPRVRWWPVAFALQRLEDRRALPALLTLVNEPQPYTKAFAAKGLGAMNDPSAAAALLPLLSGGDLTAAIEAVRSLARLKSAAAAPRLLEIVRSATSEPHLRLEAVNALGLVGGQGAADALIDLLGDRNPSVRAASLSALAQADPEGFITILSGLDQDPHWSVRAALASVLGRLAPDTGLPRLRSMLADADPKVVSAALGAIARLRPPDAPAVLTRALVADDPAVRASAANALAELKAPVASTALVAAYRRGEADDTYIARAAALAALAACSRADAPPVLAMALGDKDWAVRVRAAALLRDIDPGSDATLRIRPAPSRTPALYESSRITNPPVSTHAFIDTARGTIQLELAVLDAPLTVENFVTLARARAFDGLAIHRVVPGFVVQAGDPRGDGEGGPGYTQRDEINQRPYLRGTVGMALDWADTGGSQFFITFGPQPHLDTRYTVFGRVIAGMDVADRLEQWDVVERVRIWDGTAAQN
jgi:cyclophilin family peptidyl-prolyl cis-trans isomerase/HEAT repeat protein